MKKEKAILIGPCFGELWWELAHFAPVLFYKRKQYLNKNVKFIILTREERFDIYGRYSDILVPLIIPDDNGKYKQDCFRLTLFPKNYYNHIINSFYGKYSVQYDIIEYIYPNTSKHTDKLQFKKFINNFNFQPREDNFKIVEKTFPSDKPLISIAPRYRKDMGRNWKGYEKLYDLIEKSGLMNEYDFVLVGKKPDHVSDKKNRFFDINDFETTKHTSMIGLSIETLKKSILTIGSQSGISNLSLLLKTPALIWGHNRHRTTIEYNLSKTRVNFIDDAKYVLPPEKIMEEMNKILKKRG